MMMLILVPDRALGQPTVSITASETSVTEGDEFSLNILKPLNAESITVYVEITVQGDFVDDLPSNTTVTANILEGQSAFMLTYQTDDDDLAEDDGSITATIIANSAYTINPNNSSVTVTISNNDTPTIRLEKTYATNRQFGKDEFPLYEGNWIAFEFSRNTLGVNDEGRRLLVSLNITYLDGNTESQYIIFQPDSRSRSFYVKLTEDNTIRDATARDYIRLQFFQPELTEGYSLEPSNGIVDVKIQDDDVVVSISPEDSELTTVTEGETSTYTIIPSLDGQVTHPLTVKWQATSGGERLRATEGTFEFQTNNQNPPQIVLSLLDDAILKDHSTVTVEIVEETEEARRGYRTGTSSSVSFQVRDDDLPVVQILGLGQYPAGPVPEGGPYRLRFIRAANPITDPLTVYVSVTGGESFYPQPRTAYIIGSDEEQADYVILIEEDDVDEPDGEITITIQPNENYEIHRNNKTVTFTINDNDTRGVVVTPTSLAMDEGEDATYTVVLESEPTADVTVTVTASGDATVNPASLTFTALNWNQVQTVTVSAPEDADTKDGSATISHTVAGGDYDGETADDVAVMVTDNDKPIVTIEAVPDPPQKFEGQSVEYRLRRSRNTSEPLTVAISISEDGKVLDNRYERTWDVVFEAGQETLTFRLLTTNDDDDESASTVSAEILEREEYAVGTPNSAEILVIGQDLILIYSLVEPEPVVEGGTLRIEVTAVTKVDVMPTRHYVASIVSRSRTAKSGRDYRPVSEHLIFRHTDFTAVTINGEQRYQSTVYLDTEIFEDNYAEDSEIFILILHLAPDLEHEIDRAEVTVTITDNDPEPELAVEVSPAEIAEDEGKAGVIVSITNGSLYTERRTFTLELGGTATKGTDYRVESEHLELPEGESQVGTILTTVDDAIGEGNEIIEVQVRHDGNVVDELRRVTIVDDDDRRVEIRPTQLAVREGESGTYTVVLESEPTADVTVTVTASGDATVNPASLTFTALNWDQVQTVTVTTDHDIDAQDESATIRHTVTSSGSYSGVTADDVTVTVTDDEAASTEIALRVSPASIPEGDGQVVTVTATLNHAALTSAATVTVSVAAGTATSADFGAVNNFTVTIPANMPSGTGTFTLTPVNDDLDEDDETVTVSGTTTTAGLTVNGTTVTITDDDTRGVEISPTSLTIAEGGSGTYTLVLESQPTAEVRVVVGGRRGEISLGGSPLTFTTDNWHIAQTVTVNAGQDDDAVNDAATLINVVSSSGDYNGVTTDDVAVIVTDDDTRGVEISPTSLTIAEGGSGTYTVVLESQPTDAVTVTVGGASGDVSVSGSPLTFTTGNWNIAQTVTVNAGQDDDAVNDAVTLRNTVSSGGGYDGETADDVMVRVTDDEKGAEPGISLSVAPEIVSEDGGGQTINVIATFSLPTTRDGRTVGQRNTPEEVVRVRVTAGTATSADFNAVSSFDITIPSGMTSGRGSFRLMPVDDEIDETNETIIVRGTSSITNLIVRQANVTITDNDERGIDVTPTSLTIAEGESKTYTLVLKSQPTDAVRVVVGGAFGEIRVRGSPLTFTTDNWHIAQTVTVDAGQDNDAVNDVATLINVVSSSGDYGGEIADNVTVTVEDDDIASTEIALGVSPASFAEGDGDQTVTVTATLNHAALKSDAPVTVSVAAGTASDTDFGAVSDFVVIIPAGMTSGTETFTLSPVDDDVDEPDETLTVSGTTTGLRVTTTTVTIEDDDLPLVSFVSDSQDPFTEGETIDLTLRRNGDISVPLTVSVNVTEAPIALRFMTDVLSSSDEGERDILFSAGTSTASFSLPTTDDNVHEAPSRVTVEIQSGSDYSPGDPQTREFRVNDNDLVLIYSMQQDVSFDEDAGTVEIEITAITDQNTMPNFSYPMRFEHRDQTARAARDYRPVNDLKTFPHDEYMAVEIGGETRYSLTKQFDVTITDDDLAEETETFQVIMRPVFFVEDEQLDLSLDRRETTITIIDNDTRGVEVRPTSLEVEEGKSRTYDVVLQSQPTDAVTVTVGGASGEIRVRGSPLIFDDFWSIAQTVTVIAGQDDDAVNDTATLTHTVSGGDYGSVIVDAVTVTVTDDDERGVEISPTSLAIREGGSGTYTAVLQSQPTAAVTVTVGGASGDVSVRGSPLTFTTGNWHIAQAVTVSAAQDVDAVNDVATLSNTVTSGGDYNGETADDVMVTVTDDGISSTEVALRVSPSSVSEGGGGQTVTVTATLNHAVLTSAATVTVRVATGTATSADFGAVNNFTVTIPANMPSGTGTFTLTPINDDLDENDETVTVSGTTAGLTVNGTTVTITDDDTRGVEISPTSLTIAEGGSGTYTLVLESQPTAEVRVVVGGRRGEISLGGSPLTFATDNWNIAQTVTVNAGQDADAVNDAATLINVVSSSGDYNGVTTDDVSVTVADDETASTEIALRVSPSSVSEGGGGQVVTVTATLNHAALTSAATVTVRVAAGTAADTDFDAVSDFEVTIPEDATSGTETFTLTPVNDDLDEDDETVTVSGTTTTGLTVNGTTVTITDDDTRGVEISPTSLTIAEGGSGTYTVVLESQPTAAVTVTVGGASGDVSVRGSPLTFATDNWNIAQTVTVNTRQDDGTENESVMLSNTVTSGGDYNGETAEDVAVTVTDADERGVEISPTSLTVREGESETYTVVLESQPTAAVTVTVGGASGDVSVRGSPITFTTGNWNIAQTVTVSAAQDGDAVNDAATLSNTVTSGGDYNGETADDVTVTVTDDETASTAIALRVSPSSVSEGGGGQVVTVTATLNHAPLISAATVTVSVAAGTATSADFGAVNNFEVTIPANMPSGTGTFTLTPINDDLDENDETVTVSGTTTATGLTVNGTPVTITDDDTREVAIMPTYLTLREGNSGTYAVVLESQPTAAVTVTVGGASGEVSVRGSPLIFATDNWNIAQTVTVSAAQDDDAVNDAAALSNTVTSGGDYNGETAENVVVVVTDDDKRSVAISPPFFTVPKGVIIPEGENETYLIVQEGESETYTVVLESQPTAAVTVTVGGASGDVSVSGSPVIFTTGNWNVAQTVTVSAGQDDDAENDYATLRNTVTSGGDYNSEIPEAVVVIVIDDDTRGVAISPTSVMVQEGESETYTVVLESQPTDAVTVAVTGSGDVSGSPARLTFSTSNWGDAQTVTVSAAQDADAENEDATLSNTVTSGGDYNGETAEDVTVTVTDDETASTEIALRVSPASIPEGDGQVVTVTATLNHAVLTSAATVTVSVAAGTATENTDFGAVSNFMVIIPKGAAKNTGSFTLTSISDDFDEADETVTVSGTTTATGLTVNGTNVTITDDDTRGVTISPTSLTIAEGESETYTVVLESQPTAAVTVTVGRTSGDVSVSGSPLTFATGNWNIAQTVTVSAAQDADAENEDATLSNTVTSGGDYNGETAEDVTVTVTDDETASTEIALSVSPASIPEGDGQVVTVTATLNHAVLTSAATVTVSVAAGTATSADFGAVNNFTVTIPANMPSGTGTFTLTPVNDDLDENDETVTVSGTTAGLTVNGTTVTITDDDTRGVEIDPTSLTVREGESETYAVVLESQPTAAVTVTVGGASGDVSVRGSPITFTTGNWNIAQTVTVSAAQDGDAVNDAATLSNTVTSGGDYNGETADDVTVTVTDDETASTEIALRVSPSSVSEGGGGQTVTVTATLNHAVLTSAATVTVSVATGTATSADFGAVSDFEVTIPTGVPRGTGTFTLTPVSDDLDETDETVTVSGTTTTAGLTVNGTTVTITDDDTRGVEIDPTSLTVREGESETYAVVLESQPTAAVTVTVGGASGDVSVSGSPITFATGNWNIAQTVTVSAAQDGDAVNDAATLSNTVTSGGDYNGETADDVTVTVTDDETASTAIALRVSPSSVSEGGGGQVVTVTATLNHAPLISAATVTVSVAAGTATSADFGAVNNFAVTIPANMPSGTGTFTLTPINDDLDENDETVTVSGTTTTTGLTVNGTTVTITDDDTRGVEISPTSLTIAEGESGTYTVVLESQPTAAVTVTVGGASDDVSVRGSPLIFATGNWNIAQTVTVNAGQDADAVNDPAVTITHTVTSGGDYNGETADDVTVTVTDDDTASSEITLGVAPISVTEGGGGQTVTVTAALNHAALIPAATVTVSVAAGTATNADFGAVSDFEVTIPAGVLRGTGTFTLTPVSDDLDETDETVTVSGTTTAGLTVNGTTVTIADDDTRGVTLIPTTLTIDEGQTGLYTVVLASQPTDNVMVTTSVPSGTDVSVEPTALRFTPDDWDGVQTVMVSAGQDNDAINDPAVTITHTVSGGDYNSVSADAVTVTIRDLIAQTAPPPTPPPSGDGSGGDTTVQDIMVSFAANSYEAIEGSSVRVSVRLDRVPQQEMNIPLTVTQDNGATKADYSGVPERVIFGSNETEKSFEVTAVDDDIDDDNETVTLGFGALPNGISVGKQATAVVYLADDDTRGVLVRPIALNVPEGGDKTYTIALTSQPTAEVTVTVTAPSDSEVSVDKSVLQFTTATWNTAQTVTVSADEDDDTINDPTAMLTHVVSGGDYQEMVADAVRVTIIENDIPTLTIENQRGRENIGYMVFALRLSTGSSKDVTVAYATSSGTATEGIDYEAKLGTVTFAASETVKMISVSIIDDVYDEAEKETFKVMLSNVQNAVLGNSEAIGTIEDNDYPRVRVFFGEDNYTVNEGGHTAKVRVRLSVNPERTVTIPLVAMLNNGASETDYFGIPEHISFANGVTEKSFEVTAVDDDIDDDGETVTLGFGTLPNGVSPGKNASAIVTLVDNDDPEVNVSFDAANYEATEGESETVMVRLSAIPERTVEISLTTTLGNGATKADYSGVPERVIFGSHETEKSFEVAAVDDDIDDDDETLTLGFGTLPNGVSPGENASAMVTLVDNDDPEVNVSFDAANYEATEGGSVAMVRVYLSADPERTVNIPLMAMPNNGASDMDYSGIPERVIFASGETEKSFEVAAVDDDIDDDDETLTLGFGTLPNGVSPGENASAMVTLVDNDDPEVRVSFDAANYIAEEGGQAAKVSVRLSADPERTVTIPLMAVEGNGATQDDCTGIPKSVVFESGEMEKQFEIIAVDDNADDDGETMMLGFGIETPVFGFGTLPNGVRVGRQSTAMITLIDNDTRGVSVSVTELAVPEGEAHSYTVVLHSAPIGTVTIDVAGMTDTDVSVDRTQLVFTAENWDTPQVVVVHAQNDDDAVLDQVMLSHATSGGDYGEVVVASVAVTVIEDDMPVLTIADQAVVEHAEEMIFTVVLDIPSSEEVIVQYATINGTAEAGTDYMTTQGTLRFVALQTSGAIVVPIIDDDIDENNEAFTVVLIEPMHATLHEGEGRATGTIEDDDAAVQALKIFLSGVGRMVATDAVDVISRRFNQRRGIQPLFTMGGQPLILPDRTHSEQWQSIMQLARNLAAALGVDTSMPFGAQIPHSQSLGVRMSQPQDVLMSGVFSPVRFRQITAWDVLALSAIEMPLNPGDESGLWTLWGRGAVSGFSGLPSTIRRMEAEGFSGYLGVDYQLRTDVLLGLALMHTTGDLNYKNERNHGSTLIPIDFGITSILPYAHYQTHSGLGLWGLFGMGGGSVDMKDADGNLNTGLYLLLGAAGGRQDLTSWRDIDLAVKTDAFYISLESEASTRLPEVREVTERVRLLIEGRSRIVLGTASRLNQSLEIGGRWDRGLVENGAGLDLGGGIEYAHTALGLGLLARGRYLLAHEQAGYDEWGASLMLRVNPGYGKSGMVLSVSPVWGMPKSGAEVLWDNALRSGNPTPGIRPDRFEVDFGYQLLMRAGDGLVTPFGGWSTGGQGYQSYRIGGQIKVGKRVDVNMEGAREAQGQGIATYRVRFFGRLFW